jgi:hypothetical protein
MLGRMGMNHDVIYERVLASRLRRISREIVIRDGAAALHPSSHDSPFFLQGSFLLLQRPLSFSFFGGPSSLFYFAPPLKPQPFFAHATLCMIPNIFASAQPFLTQPPFLLPALSLYHGPLFLFANKFAIWNEAEVKVFILNRSNAGVIIGGNLNALEFQ